ncbi:hypothetical protein ABZ642_45825, partial [Streptomyces sp. NPDC007157]|uniref:hypothetical protein n=1 Tax=Streptomyces sp. NPDC007157 TaxID=3154681 RepID=UPI0033D0EB5B
GHELVPPGPLSSGPHAQVLPLDDEFTRSGRERAARVRVGEGEPIGTLPREFSLTRYHSAAARFRELCKQAAAF